MKWYMCAKEHVNPLATVKCGVLSTHVVYRHSIGLNAAKINGNRPEKCGKKCICISALCSCMQASAVPVSAAM